MKKGYLSRLNLNRNLTKLFTVVVMACLGAFGLQAQSDATITVTAPTGAEVSIAAIQSSFGTGLTSSVSGPVMEGIDTSGTALGCGMVTADLTGAIALIDRGVCGFVEKAQTAQAAGAVAVIICNNEIRSGVDQRYKAIIMGGDDMGTVTIPAVMIPYQQCTDMRVNVGSGLEVTISTDVLPVNDGETCDVSIEIGPGAYTVAPLVSGYGSQLFADVCNAAWYSYTPTSNVLATVSSCGLTDADTRLYIFTGTDCSFTDLAIVATNDDCDPDNAGFASEVSFIAQAGVRYWVYWDDRWDYSGFDFELTEGALPDVTVTFNVNMANETVSGSGVQVLYGTNPANPTTLDLADDDMDGIWSGSATLTALDTIGYVFLNGGLGGMESVPADCGVDSGLGFNLRTYIVGGVDADIPAVCFGTCLGFCPTEGCGETPTVLEDLDSYDLGPVGPQSDVWTTWSGTEGGAEEGIVSDEQAASAPNSIKIMGQNGPQDCIIKLGNETEGTWLLKFKMYVVPGANGYYNIQNDEVPGQQWNLETQFDAAGNVTFAGETATGTYPQGEWFDVIHRIDLDNGMATLSIAGKHVLTWTYGPDWKIGGIDLFATNVGAHEFYVDDLELRPLGPCPDGAIICEGFEEYLPVEVSDQSDVWAPWTSSPADDGLVTEELAYEGCQSLKISDDNPDDQLLLLGNRTSGNYLLEWYMYVPDGSLGYYNIQKYENPGQEYAIQVEWFADGTVTLDAGVADVVTFNWVPDTWSHFEHYVDLDNNWSRLVVDGVEIYGWPSNWGTFAQTGVKQLGGVDFFGNTGVLYYLDNVRLVQLPSVPGDACAGAINLQSSLGQGQNNTVSSGPYDNTNYTTNSQDPTAGWECFGEPDGLGGAPSLERTVWFTFVGDGNSYFIEALACGDNPIGDSDTQMALYSGSCGNLTPVACSEDGPNAASGYYPAGMEIDLEDGVTYYMMIDGFGPDFEQIGEFCVEFTKLNEDLTTVTFNVDMAKVAEWGSVSPDGVHIAGSFQGWDPAATLMTDNGDGTWSYTTQMAPGTEVQYKYLNGNAWGTDEVNITADCGVDGGSGSFNRALTVGMDDISTPFYCFDFCVTCDLVATGEEALKTGVKVFPNPVKGLLNVSVELPEAAENLNIRMVNALGQVVYQQYFGRLQNDNIEINVANMPAGAYMIQVADGKAQFTQSVVVQH
ncbi:MAG: T9SS type A sorting domain-containing protein [Phaeodactylibacter sp.]|nr:T9SS type A sorting domain-containing protein [Phaeodactylibacter sp.]MCB9276372.1 T9SS type A sorting domain-containing protein [Lewinellaceae bacterium]